MIRRPEQPPSAPVPRPRSDVSSPIGVRLAGAADGSLLRTLRLAWALEKGASIDDASFEDRFTAWLDHESDHRLLWIAEDGDDPVGMVNLMVFTRMPWPRARDVPGAWGYLANLFVTPSHRGRCIGARLVGACTSYADQHRFARVVLSPSVPSIPLYERAGFSVATELMVRHPGGV